MKRVLCLLSLVVFVSCNEESKVTDSNIGLVREFSPISIYGGEFQNLCQKLSLKEDRLPGLASAQVAYNFSYAQKGCKDSELGTPTDVTVSIDQLGGQYYFRSHGPVQFGFSQIETSTEGSLQEICANAQALTNPLQTGSTAAIWFRKVNDKRCTSNQDNFCIEIEKGSIDSSTNRYAIHTTELIQFRLTGNNAGFFVKRTIDTAGNCSAGQRIRKEAILK